MSEVQDQRRAWKTGSTPPPGEYEFQVRTGGRVRVWVGDGFVIVNGETKPLEQALQGGVLLGPIEE